MRTTMNLDDELLREAMEALGTRTKTETVHRALAEVIRRRAGERLTRMAGSLPELLEVPRRRFVLDDL